MIRVMIVGLLYGAFLSACLEDEPGKDAVPVDHPHPDMVPADHDHPEAKEVEPSFGTGLYATEALLIEDTCSEAELPTEYTSMGSWYVAATQDEYLFFPYDGGILLVGVDGHYFQYQVTEFIWDCLAETFTELTANLEYTELGLTGEIRLNFSSPECKMLNDAGALEAAPISCNRVWELKGDRL